MWFSVDFSCSWAWCVGYRISLIHVGRCMGWRWIVTPVVTFEFSRADRSLLLRGCCIHMGRYYTEHTAQTIITANYYTRTQLQYYIYVVHSLFHVPVSPTSTLFFLQFFLFSLLTCGLSRFLPWRTYVQGIAIPPPCTQTPSSAALLKLVNFTRHRHYFSGGEERKQHLR